MVITYKGYIARIEFEGDALFGSVENAHSILCFEGNTVPELWKAFEETIEDYLAICEERGIEADKGYSGSFLARIGWQLHREMATAAAEADSSMNAWIIKAIREKLVRKGASVGTPEERSRDLEEV